MAALATVTVSQDAARTLLGVLSQISLSVGAPDFAETAAAISQAKRELEAGLAPDVEG